MGDDRGRTILHNGINCFYASVECLNHPEVRDKPVAGDVETQHGIILAENQHAKKYVAHTGKPIDKHSANARN